MKYLYRHTLYYIYMDMIVFLFLTSYIIKKEFSIPYIIMRSVYNIYECLFIKSNMKENMYITIKRRVVNNLNM